MSTTTTGGLSTSRDALDEDDYAPTRWENLKWAVTYTTGWRIIRAAERLRMLGQRVAGDKPLTDEESRKRDYGWGYEMGRKTTVRQLARTVLRLRQPILLDDLADVAGSLGLKVSELVRAAELVEAGEARILSGCPGTCENQATEHPVEAASTNGPPSRQGMAPGEGPSAGAHGLGPSLHLTTPWREQPCTMTN